MSDAHDRRLGETLKMLRGKAKMSQEDLGIHLGLHRNVIHRYEREPGDMRLVTFRKWCALLGQPYRKVLKFADAPETVQRER